MDQNNYNFDTKSTFIIPIYNSFKNLPSAYREKILIKNTSFAIGNIRKIFEISIKIDF